MPPSICFMGSGFVQVFEVLFEHRERKNKEKRDNKRGGDEEIINNAIAFIENLDYVWGGKTLREKYYMNIEKYNQRLLAVLGTVGVIFLIVLIAVIIMENFRFSSYNKESGILSDEKIEALQKKNKREQVISYENPILIDTLNSIYIIPVSHKTLNEQEDIDVGLLLDVKRGSISFDEIDSRFSYKYYGAFNNLIIYKSIDNSIKKLFDNRVNFNEIKTEYFKDDFLILLNVSEKDTYKDGVINLLDFKKLYIYSFAEEELKSVGIEGMDVFDYKFLNDTKDLIIQFGIDKNNDGKYDEHNEPTIVKKYNFKSSQLVEIINEEINSDLQKTLEGSKK